MAHLSEVLLSDQVALMTQDYYTQGGDLSLSASRSQPHFLQETSNAFIAQAGMTILAAFALMYAYSQCHEAIEARTGMKLAHVCCLVYATLSISIDLSIKNAAESYGGHFPMNPACSVIVVEFSKLVVSAVLFAQILLQSRRTGTVVQLPEPKDIAWLAVPGAIYAINNMLVFQAIKSCPLSTFGVVRETMLVWNALIWTATFSQSICLTRWLSIGGIFFGCAMNQIPKMMNDEFSPGIVWALLLAFSNAAGAVANEYAMKQKASIDINLQNVILYGFCGSFVLIGLAVFEPRTVESSGAFFHGFVPECWQIIILQVFTGLAVSRILKYIEAVTKTIVAAVRGPGVIFLGALIFHTQLGVSEVLATLVVCTACYVYLRQGPLVKPAEAKKEPKETDSLLAQSKAAKV